MGWVRQGGRDQAGVIPRALFDLFAQVGAAERPPTVRMSYLELYNEDLYDLLTETQHTLQARAFVWWSLAGEDTASKSLVK
jgi:hypothetical protein